MSEFVCCFATRDGIQANLHAYGRGDGSLRDHNHVLEIVREFCHGDAGSIVAAPPSADERALFEVSLGVSCTRGGTSTYNGLDYRQIQPCPQRVAQAGMEIYYQIKWVLRNARRRSEGAVK